MRQRASSWIIKAVLAIIVLAFMFMGVGNFREKPRTTAATVNEETISVRQFHDRYYRLRENYRQRFGGNMTDEILDQMNLKTVAMNQLISEVLLLQKASELGIQVSDQELARSIRQIEAFQKDEKFDSQLYNYRLQHSRMTPEMFENSYRQELLVDKLKRFVTESVKVSEAEAAQWYNWQNTRIKIKAVAFPPDSYQDIKPSTQQLEAYFTEHQNEYKTEEKISLTYLIFETEDFVSTVDISPSEIRSYYEEHLQTYEIPATVEARHILIKVAQDAPAEQVNTKKQEILKIYEMIQAGKDFATCAREYSEGPSAKRGGQLGAFEKTEMVAPFAEKAFSMTAGEISEPIRTRFGWHLIQVDKINEPSRKPLEQVKKNIREKLALQKARDAAYEAALNAFDLALEKNSIKAAAAQGRKVKTSGLLTRKDRLAEIPETRELVRQAFDLYEGDISDIISFPDGFGLFQVAQRQPAKIPALDNIRSRVEADLRKELQDEKAAKEAAVFLDSLENADGIETAGEKAGLHLITTDFFGRGESIPEIGREPEISRAAFLLSRSNPCAQKVYKGQKAYYVFCLAERDIPNYEDFAADQKRIKQQLLQRKQNNVFSSWLAALTENSEITRDESLLDNNS